MWEQPLIGWSRCRTGGGATARWVWGRDKRKTKPEVSALPLLSFDQSAQIRYVLTFLSRWPGKQWIKNDLNGTRWLLVWFMAPQMDFVLSILCNLLRSLRSSHSPSFLLSRDYFDCAHLEECTGRKCNKGTKLLAELGRMAPCWPLHLFRIKLTRCIALPPLEKYKWTKPQVTQMTSKTFFFSPITIPSFSPHTIYHRILSFLISIYKLCSLPPSSPRKSSVFSFIFFFPFSPYGCVSQPFCTYHQNTSSCCLWLSLAALPELCIRRDMQIGVFFFFSCKAVFEQAGRWVNLIKAQCGPEEEKKVAGMTVSCFNACLSLNKHRGCKL